MENAYSAQKKLFSCIKKAKESEAALRKIEGIQTLVFKNDLKIQIEKTRQAYKQSQIMAEQIL